MSESHRWDMVQLKKSLGRNMYSSLDKGSVSKSKNTYRWFVLAMQGYVRIIKLHGTEY